MDKKRSSKDRHERFCQEYLVDLNQVRAYKAAGYRARGHSAEVSASRLLKQPKITKRIAELQHQRELRTQITSDAVLQEIGRLAFLNIKDFMQWDAAGNVKILPSETMTDAQAAAIAKIKSTRRTFKPKDEKYSEVVETTIELSFFQKERMVELAYKHLGLDRVADDPKKIDLEKLLTGGDKRVKEGVTFHVHNKK